MHKILYTTGQGDNSYQIIENHQKPQERESKITERKLKNC